MSVDQSKAAKQVSGPSWNKRPQRFRLPSVGSAAPPCAPSVQRALSPRSAASRDLSPSGDRDSSVLAARRRSSTILELPEADSGGYAPARKSFTSSAESGASTPAKRSILKPPKGSARTPRGAGSNHSRDVDDTVELRDGRTVADAGELAYRLSALSAGSRVGSKPASLLSSPRDSFSAGSSTPSEVEVHVCKSPLSELASDGDEGHVTLPGMPFLASDAIAANILWDTNTSRRRKSSAELDDDFSKYLSDQTTPSTAAGDDDLTTRFEGLTPKQRARAEFGSGFHRPQSAPRRGASYDDHADPEINRCSGSFAAFVVRQQKAQEALDLDVHSGCGLKSSWENNYDSQIGRVKNKLLTVQEMERQRRAGDTRLETATSMYYSAHRGSVC